MASPISKSSFPAFQSDDEDNYKLPPKPKPSKRPASGNTKARPTSASRALKHANQIYGGSNSTKSAVRDVQSNDPLLTHMSR